MEYRIVFHPKAEAELEQLYDDIAERASPVIAWNFVVGHSRPLPGLVDFSTARHRAGGDHAWAADCWLPARRQHCFCGRWRAGADPGYLLRRPEHHAGIAGRPALKRCSGCAAADIHQPGQAIFRPMVRTRRRGVASLGGNDRQRNATHNFSQANSRISAPWISPREIEKTSEMAVDSFGRWRLYTPHERGRCAAGDEEVCF